MFNTVSTGVRSGRIHCGLLLPLLALAGSAALGGCGVLDKEDVRDLLKERPGEGGGEENPCALIDCQPGDTCVVLKTSPPTAQCQPADTDPCAAIFCGPHQVCVVAESYPPQARCVDQEPVTSCYSSQDCAKGQTCSTERGDCRPPAGCDKGAACPAVCTGICEGEAPAGACKVDADCRLESNYCGGCSCEALGPGQSGVACSDPVTCVADPCRAQRAACVAGACKAVAAASTSCEWRIEGGETSCKPADVWKRYAIEFCGDERKSLKDISLGTPCGGDSYRYMKYECCN